MAYPAKKPFGIAQGKPFKKFDKKPFGSAPFSSARGKQSKPLGKKPFGFKSAYKKTFGPAQRKPFSATPGKSYGASGGPQIRATSVIGEHAPKPTDPKFAPPKPGAAPWVKKSAFKQDMKPATDKKLETSWGGVANWYHDTVEEKGSYQRDLILPNLLRLLDIKKGETVLDLACGEGFFSRRFNRLGAKVVASDISKELIAIARKDKDAEGVQFEVAPADKISFVADASVDKAVIVLALQNIENVPAVFAEVARVLKPTGKLFFVINHPAFRIPKQSSWGWEGSSMQYRRVDRYLAETREKIVMHPSTQSPAKGGQADEVTISFHRPMQYFVKALKKNGFALTAMEEWTSDRKSQPGPRAEAENRARVEIPLFMCVEARRIQIS